MDKINRFEEPGLEGLLCDLLWSDPIDDSLAKKVTFKNNRKRECAHLFGLEPVKRLLKKNSLLSIIRAHEVQIDGFKCHRWGGKAAFPPVITVFSAPNYCKSYGNKAAVILFHDNEMKLK